MLWQRALLEGEASMRGCFLTFSHAYKEMRESTSGQAVGKEPPSLGSGGPSPTAVGLRLVNQQKGAVWSESLV